MVSAALPASVTTSGAAASFTVVATGSGTLTYQWYKDGTAISGATASTYNITAASESDEGSYTVTITNSAGVVTSSAAVLTVSMTTASDCTVSTYSENVRCAVEAFSATLSSSQLSSFQYTTDGYTSAQIGEAKTRWSNLPAGNVQRSGISYGSLSTTQKAALVAVARAALTDQGYKDFVDVLAADDYLGASANRYGSDLYYIAVEGKPDASALWMLQIGGHHMAFNISFSGGLAYPTPHHIGVEPKASFTVNGASYQALADKAAFASSISGLGFDPWTFAVSLLGFNLGIETMQLAIVAVVLPMLLLASRYRACRPAGHLQLIRMRATRR